MAPIGEGSIDRRTVLKLGGQAGIVFGLGAAGFAGSASATEGKGVSWIAFCGCEEEDVCIAYAITKEDDEIYRLAYEAPDDCTVYYKAGREIYEHTYSTRDDAEVLNTGGYHTDDGIVFDPAMDVHPSASRDPCGIIGESSTGFKIEEDEIPLENPDCSVED